MAKSQQIDGLEISEDFPFQQRMWRAQRIGWAVFALIIVAATLGLFGHGLLSSASAESGPLRVSYNRFERFETPTSLDIIINPSGSGAAAEVWLPHSFLEHVEVTSIMPEPQEMRGGDGRIIYSFLLQEAGGEATITFHLTPMRPGPIKGEVGLDDGPSVQFTQLVYP
jgi:hypothetical protein